MSNKLSKDVLNELIKEALQEKFNYDKQSFLDMFVAVKFTRTKRQVRFLID